MKKQLLFSLLLLAGLLAGAQFAPIQAQSLLFPQNGTIFQRANSGHRTIRFVFSGINPSDGIRLRFKQLQAPSGNPAADYTDPRPRQRQLTADGWVVTNMALDNNGRPYAELQIRSGMYNVEISLNNGQYVATPGGSGFSIGVGEVFYIAGQSNAAGFKKNGNTSYDNFSSPLFKFANLKIRSADEDPMNVGPMNTQTPDRQFNYYWGGLAKKLITQLQMPVAFYQAATSSTTIKQWWNSAVNGTQLNPSDFQAGFPYGNLKQLLNRNGSGLLIDGFAPVEIIGLRAVLWHQGETDNLEPGAQKGHDWSLDIKPDGTFTNENYTRYLSELIASSRGGSVGAGKPIPWMVARTSYNNNVTSSAVTNAQTQAINNNQVFAGPNTDVIGSPGDRVDGTHLAPAGQAKAADLWFNALMSGDFFQNSVPCAESPYTTTVPPPLCEITSPITIGTWNNLVVQMRPFNGGIKRALVVLTDANPNVDMYFPKGDDFWDRVQRNGDVDRYRQCLNAGNTRLGGLYFPDGLNVPEGYMTDTVSDGSRFFKRLGTTPVTPVTPPTPPGGNNVTLSVDCETGTLRVTGSLAATNRVNVQIFRDGSIVDVLQDLQGSSFDQNVVIRGNGSHYARAMEVNNDNNRVTSATTQVSCGSNPTTPTTPPPPTTPVAPPGGNNITFSANCGTKMLNITGSLAVTNRVNVQIFRDGTIVGILQDLVGPSFNRSWTFRDDGTYYVRAMEVNNDNNQVTSAATPVSCASGPTPPTTPVTPVTPVTPPGSNSIAFSVNCGARTLNIIGSLAATNRINIQILRDGAINNIVQDLTGPSFNQTVSLGNNGAYYVRAMEVNNDNNRVTSATTQVNCAGGRLSFEPYVATEEDGEAVQVFPNPAIDAVTVRYYQQLDGVAKLRILSLSGAILMQRTHSGKSGLNDVNINLAEHAAGNKLVLVEIQVENKRLVKRIVR